jgi:hypothetical protein
VIFKRLPYEACEPQRPRDVLSTLLYLLTPQATAAAGRRATGERLLGPPVFAGLLSSVQPWGETVKEAAEDLTLQLERFCLRARGSRGLPFCWVAQTVVSFSAADSRILHQRSCRDGTTGSKLAFAVDVAEDMLDRLGAGGALRKMHVVHADTAHLHVHSIICQIDDGGEFWDLEAVSPRFIAQQVLTVRSERGLHLSRKSLNVLAAGAGRGP